MVFDYSCLDGALNDILMNPVLNLEFHKLLGNLTCQAIIWYLRKYCLLYVIIFMISGLLFCSDVHFSSSSSHNI